MKKINLTQGKYAKVDDSDFDWLNKYNWCVTANGYAISRLGGGHYVRMHRLIMNTPDGLDTDHINGDRLDNRRSNLRVVTRSENNANRHNLSLNTSGYRGVNYDKQTGRWRAGIRIKGKTVSLGRFNTPQEASVAYQNRRGEVYKEMFEKVKEAK